MDVESLAKELILKNMTPEQQMAVLDSVRQSVVQAKEVQKKKIGENVDLVVQALKKIESDIRDRFDAVGNTIEKRVSSIKDGRDGANGKDGRDGKDGKSGRDGLKGDRGVDGQAGRDGANGVDGVSVTNAHIDFDGSLVISLSDGRELNVGEVVSQDIAEKIKVISTMSTNAAIAVKEEGTTITSGVKSINFVGTGITATTSGDDVTVTVASGSGTVTSVAATAGTGISITGSPITTSGTLNITNTAPDQTVVLTAGTGINTSGTYPSFTVTNSAPDQTVALTQGGTTTITGIYPNFTISSADQYQGTVTSVTGTSPVASTGGATPAISLAASYGDTQNPYASKTANFVLAAPNGAAGAPTFRAIVASDIPTLNQSTTGSAATLTTPRAIYGNNFDGSAALTQIIASTYGGTGNGFTKFTGATTAERTYTLPDATTTILTSNAAVTVGQGGTGQTTYTDGQLLIGNTTGNTLTKATLTAGTGIAITNGNGSISIASTATGTVTSVAATVPAFLSITGSPVTTSGTLAIGLSGTALPVANGGTGVTSSTGSGANVLGTSPSISGAVLSSMASSVITSGTLVTASGTSVNFTSLPSWVKRITVMLVGISSNGSSMPTVRIGDSGGISATGYLGSVMCGSAATLFTTGFEYGGGLQNATRVWHGAITINLQNSSTNTWAATGVISLSDGASTVVTAGSKSLTSALTQVRITYVNGTDSFDAGSINILYE